MIDCFNKSSLPISNWIDWQKEETNKQFIHSNHIYYLKWYNHHSFKKKSSNNISIHFISIAPNNKINIIYIYIYIYDWFEFRVFLLLNWLPKQDERTQSALIFTHSWKDNRCIHAFPVDISIKWNVNSFGPELNSIHQINFLR